MSETTASGTELRQLLNSVEIVGTLKSKHIEEKVSKTSGKEFVIGNLVILSEFDGKIQEQKVKIFVMKSSKLYKGVETVKNEYKSIEEVGKEQATRLRVSGELKLNEYYNGQGKLVSFNEIKGVFFNRLDETNDQPDKAIASIETVVKEFTQQLDSEQLPTGNYLVKGFTVGWGNEVIELRNAIIGEELAEAFMNLYQPGTTGRLTFKLNNYVETVQKEVESVPTHGFGSTDKVESNEIRNFTNNLEIIGGDMPFFGTKEYLPEEIEQAEKVRALTLQALSQPAPDVPQTNTGFGAGAPTTQTTAQSQTTPPAGTIVDGMPDF